MLDKIQSMLIRWILAPLAKVKTLVPEKIWSVIITLSTLGVILMQFAISAGWLTRYLYGLLLFCLYLAVLILAGLSKEIKPVYFSPAMLVSWFGMSLFILLTGLLRNHDCLGDAMIWLAAFPVVYIVWCNRDFQNLAKPVINGVYLSFLAMILLLMWDYPIKNINFKGFFLNSNGLAMYCTTVFVTVLADMMSQKRFSARVVVMALVAGMAVSVSYCTNSRAGQYVMTAVAACAAVLFLLVRRENLLKSILCYILPLVLAVTLLFSNGVKIINSGADYIDDLQSAGAKKAATVQTNTDSSDEKEKNNQKTEKTEKTTEDTLETIRKRNEQRQAEGQNGDFTTGRTELWSIYIPAVKVLGNTADHTLYYENGKEVTKSAHNSLIQMAYEYGAVVAIFFLAFNLVSGVRALIFAWKNRAWDYSAFPLLIAVCYGMYYLVEKIIYPSHSLLLLLYLLTQAAVFAGNRRQKAGRGKDIAKN